MRTRGRFSGGCRLAAGRAAWRANRFIAPLFISGPPTRRRSAAHGGLICLHLERSRAPKSFLALRTPLSISSTKRVFLHQKEDGAHYGIPLLLSALKYRSLCVTAGGAWMYPTHTHSHTHHPAQCRLPPAGFSHSPGSADPTAYPLFPH